MIFSDLKSFKNAQERLFYTGIEQKKQRDEKNRQLFEEVHPFRPNFMKYSHELSTPLFLTPEKIDAMSQPRKSPIKARLTGYLERRFDAETDQEFFTPVINKYDPKVFKKAYQAKLNQEINARSKNLDKKAKAVFNYLSFNRPVLSIRDFDSLNIKNECITLLKDVLIALINDKPEVDFEGFLDLMIDKNLLLEIESTYDFIKDKNEEDQTNPKLRKLKKNESEITSQLQSAFDKNVRQVFKEQFRHNTGGTYAALGQKRKSASISKGLRRSN